MTEAATETLNNESETSTDETLNTGESSTPRDTGDDLVSTAEFEVQKPEETQEDQGTESESKTVEDENQGTTEEGEFEGEKGPIPYERFQEKVKQVQQLTDDFNTHKLDTAKQIAELKGQIATPKESSKDTTDKGYTPVQTMSEDGIRDAMEENPVAFMANLAAQIQQETREEVLREINQTNTQQTYQERISEFGENNEGFTDLLNSGKLEQYAKNNPGYDLFSAYNELTKDQREKSVQEKIATEVKAALEKQKTEFQNNQKAKRELRTVSQTSAPTHHEKDAELKNLSDTHGGLVSGLAARLSAGRAKAG